MLCGEALSKRRNRYETTIAKHPLRPGPVPGPAAHDRLGSGGGLHRAQLGQQYKHGEKRTQEQPRYHDGSDGECHHLGRQHHQRLVCGPGRGHHRYEGHSPARRGQGRGPPDFGRRLHPHRQRGHPGGGGQQPHHLRPVRRRQYGQAGGHRQRQRLQRRHRRRQPRNRRHHHHLRWHDHRHRRQLRCGHRRRPERRRRRNYHLRWHDHRHRPGRRRGHRWRRRHQRLGRRRQLLHRRQRQRRDLCQRFERHSGH